MTYHNLLKRFVYRPFTAFIFILVILAGCQETAGRGKTNFLAVGDSLTAWNSLAGASIPHVIEQELGVEVVDRSVRGARFSLSLQVSSKSGFYIPGQYQSGNWDWVIVNGGGNDMLGCGCAACGRTIDRLISPDSQSGEIPNLIQNALRDGAQVIYFGYLRSPKLFTLVEHCKGEIDTLETRVRALSEQYARFHFISNADLVPPGDASYFDIDLVHPSRKGSAAIARSIVQKIRSVQPVGMTR